MTCEKGAHGQRTLQVGLMKLVPGLAFIIAYMEIGPKVWAGTLSQDYGINHPLRCLILNLQVNRSVSMTCLW